MAEKNSSFDFGSRDNNSFNHQQSSFPYSSLHYQQSNAVNYANPLNKLFCALLSGLPNDMDFGLHITTMLVSSREVEWIADYKFVEVLIDCCKLYACCCDDIYETTSVVSDSTESCDETCNTTTASGVPKQNLVLLPTRCSCLPNFWSKLCNDSSVIEKVFEQSDCKSLYHHDVQTQDLLYKRVLRIAELIRTLSFSIERCKSDETHVLYVPISLQKLLVLLLTSEDSKFNAIGLDIISNIASHITHDKKDDDFSDIQKLIFQKCVVHIVNSNDIYCLNRSLEVITKIVTTNNDEVTVLVTKLLDSEVCEPCIEGNFLISFLTAI